MKEKKGKVGDKTKKRINGQEGNKRNKRSRRDDLPLSEDGSTPSDRKSRDLRRSGKEKEIENRMKYLNYFQSNSNLINLLKPDFVNSCSEIWQSGRR